MDIRVILGDELEWSPCLMRCGSHSGAVLAVAISPDGTRIASGSVDNTIHIHDAASGGFVMALTGTSDVVLSVAFSPDGSRLASGSVDEAIRLWDAATGRELLKFGVQAEAFSVAFSPDGDRIASGFEYGDQTVKVWAVATGDLLLSLEGHSSVVNSVGFFPDGGRLASGSFDETIRIWDLESRTCIAVLEGHSGSVHSVAISLDGSRIASVSNDHTIRIWDVSSGMNITTLRGHGNGVRSVTISPDGSRIAFGSADGSLSLRNATTGVTIAKADVGFEVGSVAFSYDGRRIVSGSEDGTIKIWDADALAETIAQDHHSSLHIVESVTFSSDAARLALMGWDRTVHLWDLERGSPILSFRALHPPFDSIVRFSPDDTQIIVGREGCTPNIYDASSGKQIEGEGRSILAACDPSRTPFKVEHRRLIREDVSPPVTVCILPRFYHTTFSVVSSHKLDRGDRVAIVSSGKLLVMDVPPC